MQQSGTVESETITEAFRQFYYNFIEQLPGIGLALLIIILGVLIGIRLGKFSTRRISART